MTLYFLHRYEDLQSKIKYQIKATYLHKVVHERDQQVYGYPCIQNMMCHIRINSCPFFIAPSFFSIVYFAYDKWDYIFPLLFCFQVQSYEVDVLTFGTIILYFKECNHVISFMMSTVSTNYLCSGRSKCTTRLKTESKRMSRVWRTWLWLGVMVFNATLNNIAVI